MPDEKKSYRITTKRPIGGRMRKEGEIVALTDREYQNEAGWGGIEPVKDDAAPKVVATVTIDEDVERRLSAADTEATGKKRK
ncbi:hypothetical protein IP86_10785 [Rhodopseudomonas sp. AAP120]|uniref:hypothetical protein n=1 Tax=Rhodopseudomonas sp. AAP120 TaxID=1523430 RepID=UPI0006B8F8FF|nr:hypothetical protein [Rhodopseudomonas sp. AAP120]KPF98807.1 hypothetical protein IP86_10785 [Rhodopseudomonas sp. AAP120]